MLVNIKTSSFSATIDEGTISLSNLLSGQALEIRERGYEILCENGDSSCLEHEIIYTKREGGFSYCVRVANKSGKPVTIKKIILLKGITTSALMRPSGSELDLSKGEAGFIEDNFSDLVDNYPIFIDDNMFCGIDWPVAYNHFEKGRLDCTQFCNVTLDPGQSFTSKTMSFGVAQKGNTGNAFLKHLEDIKGRTAPRKSMYFTWLTHAWEGLSKEGLEHLADYLIMLNKEYGIHFDVILLDAGIIETLHTYFDHYRYKGKETIEAVGAIAERFKAIGSDMGIWLGPDDFKDSDILAAERIKAVKKMVSDWNVSMIKLDVAVSYPLSLDREKNERYMNNLYRQMEELRAERPDLLVINHRISGSPYILSVLDSTLWEGMETYPDVYLMNLDKPRLKSRMATYARGIPAYCGCYSHLLEDHGVCFNGTPDGWEEDFIIQAFGRSLVVSPEVYGSLFLLGDEAYQTFAYLMSLAQKFKRLLAHTAVCEDMYVHSNGNEALVCIFNDNFFDVTRQIDMSKYINTETCKAEVLYPVCQTQYFTKQRFDLVMSPFQTALIHITHTENDPQNQQIDVRQKRFIPLNEFEERTPADREKTICEEIFFDLSSDPMEMQALSQVNKSVHPEVEKCRMDFIDKMKDCFAVSSSAWDGSFETAWGDKMHYDKRNAVWRLNLGKKQAVQRVEITLSQMRPGPVIGMEKGRTLPQIIPVEISSDCTDWQTVSARQYGLRILDMEFPSKIIMDLGSEHFIQYLKFHFNGVLISDITVKDGAGEELDTSEWKGNNLLPSVLPVKMFSKGISVGPQTEAVTVQLSMPGGQIPLSQTVAVVWVENGTGEYRYARKASPAYPFNGWENNTYHTGNGWSYTVDGINGMTGECTLKCAVFELPHNPGDEKITEYTIEGGIFQSIF